MQFMGDWAKGEFTAAGLTPGKEYGCTVLSDHGMAYVMGGDVFAFPRLKDPPDQGAAVARPRAVGAQNSDRVCPEERLDPGAAGCGHQLARYLRAQGVRLGRRQKGAGPCKRMLSPPALTGAIEDIISQYWNDPTMTTDTFITKVASTLSQQF